LKIIQKIPLIKIIFFCYNIFVNTKKVGKLKKINLRYRLNIDYKRYSIIFVFILAVIGIGISSVYLFQNINLKYTTLIAKNQIEKLKQETLNEEILFKKEKEETAQDSDIIDYDENLIIIEDGDVEIVFEQLEEIEFEDEIENERDYSISENNVDFQNYYWLYKNYPLLDVDFAKLKETNDETVAWLKVYGTDVNYPVVQSTTSSDFYLTHSFDKSKNSAGWLFVDSRNEIKEFNQNTIIFGHGGAKNVLFDLLKVTLNKEWYQNKENHIISLTTENAKTLWHIFTVYTTPPQEDYLQIFYTKQQFANYIQTAKEKSNYDYNVEVTEDDKILTLSTCYGSLRLVVQAKLIVED